jgi:3-methyladenine DNA glycosylase/8-oxoguanine DNA glycosylase
VRAIVYQQLAGAAAAAIHGRLLALSNETAPPTDTDAEPAPPDPAQLLNLSDAALRGAGLSGPKIGYLRDLASRCLANEIDLRLTFDDLPTLDDAAVTARLTAVKGIGEWTAQMFLISQLGRLDVLPVGDLGVRKGMHQAYRLRKLPSPRRMHEIARHWRPYRSAGAWYMWRAAETRLP